MPQRSTQRVDQDIFSRAVAETLTQKRPKPSAKVYIDEPTYAAAAPAPQVSE